MRLGIAATRLARSETTNAPPPRECHPRRRRRRAGLWRITDFRQVGGQGRERGKQAGNSLVESGRRSMDGYDVLLKVEVPIDKLLLTPVEAAAVLSLGRSKVYELLRSGELPSVRIGACRRIPAQALTTFLEDLLPARGDCPRIGPDAPKGRPPLTAS